MAVFKDLSNTERMEEPEDREAEDIHRGSDVYNKHSKIKRTSVSEKSFSRSLGVMSFIIGIIVLLIVIGVVYEGIKSFIS